MINEQIKKEMDEISNDELAQIWVPRFKTLIDLQEEAHRQLNSPAHCLFSLEAWMPQLGYELGEITTGEMFCILSDTGAGKTLFLQQLMLKMQPQLKTLFFEMELPDIQIAERFYAMQHKVTTRIAREHLRSGVKTENYLPHVTFCTSIKFSIQDIIDAIKVHQSQVVIIDYMGLIRDIGKSRYERLSDIAEELKLIATTMNCVMIVAVQIHRKTDDAPEEIFIHDARDSSSIENSAQRMLGLWRQHSEGRNDGDIMKIKILKNQGKRGSIFTTTLDTQTLNIIEDERQIQN